MIYDATSKDPRKELRMLSSFSSFNGQSLDEFILTLHKSPHTASFNSRHVKMNKFVIISKKGNVVLEISADMSTKLIRNIERKNYQMMIESKVIILLQIKIIINFTSRKKFSIHILSILLLVRLEMRT